jgi:molybdenum cofactor guanylyltransferase
VKSETPLAAILLAGGQSRRMGRTKAELLIDGETLLDRTVRILGEITSEIVVVLAADARQPRPIRCVRDRRAGRGPLEGLAAGLKVVRAEIVLVLPCDLPRLHVASLLELREHLGDGGGCCPILEGIPRPLPGVFRRTMAGRIDELLAQNRLALQGLLTPEIRSYEPSDPLAFAGANTPEEWQLLTGSIFPVAESAGRRHADG